MGACVRRLGYGRRFREPASIDRSAEAARRPGRDIRSKARARTLGAIAPQQEQYAGAGRMLCAPALATMGRGIPRCRGERDVSSCVARHIGGLAAHGDAGRGPRRPVRRGICRGAFRTTRSSRSAAGGETRRRGERGLGRTPLVVGWAPVPVSSHCLIGPCAHTPPATGSVRVARGERRTGTATYARGGLRSLPLTLRIELLILPQSRPTPGADPGQSQR